MSENDVEESRPYPKRGETIWTYGEEDDPVQRTRWHENDKFIVGLWDAKKAFRTKDEAAAAKAKAYPKPTMRGIL